MDEMLRNAPSEQQEVFKNTLKQMVLGEGGDGNKEMSDQELQARMMAKLGDLTKEKNMEKQQQQKEVDEKQKSQKKQEDNQKPGKSSVKKGFLSHYDKLEDNSKANELKLQGNTAFKEKNYQKAIEFYSKALEYDPYNHVLYSNRSMSYYELKNYLQAAKDGQESIKQNSKWVKGWYRLGLALVKLEKIEEARSAFYTGLQVDPKNEELNKAMDNLPKRPDLEFTSEQESEINKVFKNKQPSDNDIKKITPKEGEKSLFDNESMNIFQKPEYMQALQQFQHDPAGVLKKFGNDPLFLGAIQSFASQTGHGELFNKPQEQPQKTVKKPMSREEMERDWEVKEIMEDPQVKNLMGYISNGHSHELNWNDIYQNNPELGKKIDILKAKNVISDTPFY